jgi:hypothetical protein
MTKHSMNLKRDKTPATSHSIGIDLGDRFSELCVLDEKGAVVSPTAVRSGFGPEGRTAGAFGTLLG